MSYFIHDGVRQLGPFTIEQLKEKGITKTTPVWKEGITDWVEASSLLELQSMIFQSPPAFPGHAYSPAQGQTTSGTERLGYNIVKYWEKSILVAVLAVVVMCLFLRWNGHSYQPSISLHLPTVDPEHSLPKQFLAANGTYHPNFWGTKEEISGTITNRANHTNYKDVHVRVIFYSQTNSIISSQEYILYQYFPYGSTTSFSLTVNKPAAAATCGWVATDATFY